MYSTQQQTQMSDRIVLNISYLLTAGAWLINISLFCKIILTILAGITSIMAFMNQYKILQKNYKTLWIIIQVEQVLTRMQPKKNRHRKNISHSKKNIEND